MQSRIAETVSKPCGIHQYDQIYQDLIKTLHFLSDAGCKGFACSPQSLQIINSWKQMEKPHILSKADIPASSDDKASASVRKTPSHNFTENLKNNPGRNP